jgi:hypothetical protein
MLSGIFDMRVDLRLTVGANRDTDSDQFFRFCRQRTRSECRLFERDKIIVNFRAKSPLIPMACITIGNQIIQSAHVDSPFVYAAPRCAVAASPGILGTSSNTQFCLSICRRAGDGIVRWSPS